MGNSLLDDSLTRRLRHSSVLADFAGRLHRILSSGVGVMLAHVCSTSTVMRLCFPSCWHEVGEDGRLQVNELVESNRRYGEVRMWV